MNKIILFFPVILIVECRAQINSFSSNSDYLKTIITETKVLIKPTQKISLLTDTLYWTIEKLKLKGTMLFSKLDEFDTFNNDVAENQKFVFRIKGPVTDAECVSDENDKLIYPVEFDYKGLKKTLNIIFWPGARANFDPAFQKKFSDTILYSTPATFELVNIVFALTKSGSRDDNLFMLNKPYYNDVREYFSKVQTHPLVLLMDSLNRTENFKYLSYLTYITESLAYNVDTGNILPKTQYKWLGTIGSSRKYISDHISLWSDFIKKSGFEIFYSTHRKMYESSNENCKNKSNPAAIKNWLYSKTGITYNSVLVQISPILNSFHQTTKYSSNGFTQCVINISDESKFYNWVKSEKKVAALYSGTFFTEISHHYINPVSELYKKQIDSIFKSAVWASAKGQGIKLYNTPVAVFNEYMTHAVFLLYAKEMNTPDDFSTVFDFKIRSMKQRGFIKFEEFYEAVNEIYTQNPGIKIQSLYPLLMSRLKALN